MPRDKQVPILLSAIGAPIYSFLSDLLSPDLPSTKSMDALISVLRGHFEPRRVVIAERFHFYKRDQLPGESMCDFDAALRKLATHCRFGEALEEALRDRFVCGLRHNAIQRRLLTETDLTYSKALDVARSIEAAEANSKAFKATEPSIKKFTGQMTKAQQNCYRCGRKNHSAATCKFRDAECHSCGKRGILLRPADRNPGPSRHNPNLCANRKCTERTESMTMHQQAFQGAQDLYRRTNGGSRKPPC